MRPTKLPALVYFIFMDPYGIAVASVLVASLADEVWALVVVLAWVLGLLSVPLYCPLEVTRERPPHPLWRALTTAVGWAMLFAVVFVIALMLWLP